jgi:hypothetical protein
MARCDKDPSGGAEALSARACQGGRRSPPWRARSKSSRASSSSSSKYSRSSPRSSSSWRVVQALSRLPPIGVVPLVECPPAQVSFRRSSRADSRRPVPISDLCEIGGWPVFLDKTRALQKTPKRSRCSERGCKPHPTSRCRCHGPTEGSPGLPATDSRQVHQFFNMARRRPASRAIKSVLPLAKNASCDRRHRDLHGVRLLDALGCLAQARRQTFLFVMVESGDHHGAVAAGGCQRAHCRCFGEPLEEYGGARSGSPVRALTSGFPVAKQGSTIFQ